MEEIGEPPRAHLSSATFGGARGYHENKPAALENLIDLPVYHGLQFGY